jgi:D-serine deaminase-like pyridoxal phosphate-dependent protein
MKLQKSVTYKIENIDLLDTPALVVYPSIVKRNIEQLIRLFNDVRQIRPHVKTHKTPEVVDLLLESGIRKFKCATIAEAEMLAGAGALDVLLAYQPVGPKIDRFINLMLKYPKCQFTCLIDNETSAEHISKAANQNNVQAKIFLDLNIGMDRTGVELGEEAKRLFLKMSRLANITIVGLHAYDGHLTNPDVNIRLIQAETGFAGVKNLADELASAGYSSLQIVAGSTPTISFYAQQPDVECSPGTFIYWDQFYQNSYPELPFQSAALVVTRVISKPTPATACLDLGYKAISSEGEISQRVSLLELPKSKVISQSEEHLLISSGTNRLPIGEVVYGLPYHIGRTCNLYEASAVIEGQKVSGQWLHTARARRLTI